MTFGMTGRDPLGIHQHGVRLDNVTHACPRCPIFYPSALCPVCQGRGQITELELALYSRRKLGGEIQ